MAEKKYLNCAQCGSPVLQEKSEVLRVNKSSNLIQRFCYPCLDKYIYKTQGWLMPYSEFDTHVKLNEKD